MNSRWTSHRLEVVQTRAGGHPGGVCRIKQPAGVVAANGFAIDARDAGNLALWGVALQQCDDGGALVGFQDIHSLAFLRGRPEHASCPQVPTVSALRPCPRSIQVGEFEVAIRELSRTDAIPNQTLRLALRGRIFPVYWRLCREIRWRLAWLFWVLAPWVFLWCTA